MTDFDTLAQRYIATWNETDAAARQRAVAALYTEDARYTDPLVDAEGQEAIAATIGAVQQQFPGFVFRLAGPGRPRHRSRASTSRCATATAGWRASSASWTGCRADRVITTGWAASPA